MSLPSQRIRFYIPPSKLLPLREEAQARNRKVDRFGDRTYNQGLRGEEAHMIGVRTELAVSLYFGVDRDTTILDRHGDDGRDLILPELGATQIKSTHARFSGDPFLRAECVHDKASIASYMLVLHHNDPHVVDLVGWLPRDIVIDRTPQRLPGGYGTVERPLNYIVQERELNPIPLDLKRLGDHYREFFAEVRNANPALAREFREYYIAHFPEAC